ncbi:MAG: TAXI family TRAP transporter solute-binding subunit [Burkholderiaceae bacterium]|nr:TAXI family TRAP transporter solute-binding subunit [Rhodoferax sp.]MCB2042659.1 TAXI family TRAP transporter solute-binding subunit [Rhodoferax sp.]MCP5263324.1 TAXI family TRAP transporter solute-binding subunit [Rhodoferax sp.]MCW5629459.1 TAXI family TRAP transporter solute-binding subunit [Rhodoferax sp.]MCW5643491.1 TAXI family TRAP transporter solute-binding subunit [Rhodoferax sp.]
MTFPIHRTCIAIAALVCGAGAAQAQQIKLMTGPQGGSWYPLGGAIANIADKAGMKVQVLPGAGIANVKGVDGGKADMGFGNSISTVDGVAGKAPFDAQTKNVCNVASLYPQYYQVVANADANINSLGDLKGKSLAVQPKGNTAEFISMQSLEVYGLKYGDMGRVSYVSYTDAVSLMKDNNAQVFTLGTTVPASAIMDLASARDIKLIGIPDDKFQAMRKLNPGYTKLVIPAGSYPKQTQDVQTIGYATHLIARCDLDETVVYKMLKGLVDNKADLAAIAKAMSGVTPKMMAEDIGVPLHKGAMKYYKEVGAL